MRKFYLQNENGVIYDLCKPNTCLVSTATNLGVELTNTYYEYSNSYRTAVSKMTMMKPTLVLRVFNGYKGYNELINYIFRSKDLKLFYTSNDTKYCHIDVVNVAKSELTTNDEIQVQLTMNRKSMWVKEFSVELNVSFDVKTNSKIYNYNYDYEYIEINNNNELVVTNNGHLPAPVNIKVEDGVDNLKIEVKVNDEVVNSTAINYVNSVGTLTIISDEGEEEMRYEEDGDIFSIYKYQDFTRDGFIYIPVGTSTISITNNVNSAKYTFTFHELYRGN